MSLAAPTPVGPARTAKRTVTGSASGPSSGVGSTSGEGLAVSLGEASGEGLTCSPFSLEPQAARLRPSARHKSSASIRFFMMNSPFLMGFR